MRSRSILPIALLAAGALAAPAAAATRTEHDFSMKLTKSRPSTPTGVSFLTDRVSYVPPAFGQPADRVARTVFSMPAGTRTDLGAVPQCTKAALEEGGVGACPAGSKIGSGTASAITGLVSLDPVPFTVTVFASSTGLLAHLAGLQTSVIELGMKGSRITADVPRTCLPPGTPADNCRLGDVVLKTLNVKLAARRSGRRSLITTPRRCPSTRVWTYKAVYTYVNGDTETQTTTTRCRR